MCPFPVGYVYLSSNNTSPATTYGGTWSALNESRYLRLAGAWGTGGSNTISVDQMPSHTHGIEMRVASDHNPGGTVFQGSATNANWFPAGAARVTAIGGGQHSIQATEMCMLGTEQPNSKEDGKLCVTFKTLGSKLALLMKRFVHFQLDTSICQRTAQVQQAFMEGAGHLLQTVNSCGQAVVGTLQAVNQRINSLLTRCQHTVTQLHGHGTRVLKTLVEINGQSLYNPRGRTDGKKTRLTALITRAEIKHIITSLHIGLVTHGIEPLKVGVAYA